MVVSGTALASNRPFTYTYTTYAAPAGQWEFEQWVEYQGKTEEDSDFQRWGFREEIEFAPTDNLSLAFYAPNWHYQESSDGSETKFDSFALEAIWYLTNPVTDPVGIGLYAEVSGGDEDAAVEGKLLLHKDIGKWTLAYNLIMETEVEDAWKSEKEYEGELGHSFGVAYSLPNGIKVGAELTIESEYEDWKRYEKTAIYAGPAFSYQGGKIFGSDADWWVAVTPMFLIGSNAEEPDFKTRMILGVEF